MSNLLTAMQVQGSDDKDILVASFQDEDTKKYGGLAYILDKEGSIRRLLYSTEPIFDTKETAEASINIVVLADLCASMAECGA